MRYVNFCVSVSAAVLTSAAFSNAASAQTDLEKAMGYDKEIEYFLDCIARGERPNTVTIEDAANAIKLVEAEAKSVATGKPVKVK